MSKGWPQARDFNLYLEDLMRAAGIPNRAELSRLSGVSQTQLSMYKAGTHRPSREGLRRLAEPLNVSHVKLWLKAGLATPEELSLDDPVYDVMPRQIQRLGELFEQLDGRDRDDFLSLCDRVGEWAQARVDVRRLENRSA